MLNLLAQRMGALAISATGLLTTGVLWLAQQAPGTPPNTDHLFGVAAVIAAAGTVVVGVLTAVINLIIALRRSK